MLVTPPSSAGVLPSVGDGEASAHPNASSTRCVERTNVNRVSLLAAARCCTVTTPDQPFDSVGMTCCCSSSRPKVPLPRSTGMSPVVDGIRKRPSRVVFRMLIATGWMSAGVSSRKVSVLTSLKNVAMRPAC